MTTITSFGPTLTIATRPLATSAIPFNKAASRITALSNGQLAVVWGGETGYTDQYGVFLTRADVFARVLNSDGSFAGNEFVVRQNVPDTSVSDGHPAPSVTALADGRFVISTEQVTTSNDAERGPTLQVFNANGTAASGIIRLSTQHTQYGFTSTVYGWDPVLATLSDGRFVSVWRPINSTVAFRVFNPDGSVSSAGSAITVDDPATPGPEFTYDPAVAALSGGGFAAAWESARSDGSGTSIRARLYSSAGAPLAAEFIVNTTTTSGQHEPSIVALSDGRFVITWVSEDPGDGDGTTLRGRIFSAAGAAAGNDFIVSTTYQGNQLVPSMAALANGRFVAVWRSTDQGSGDVDTIRARVFESNGTAAADFIVGTEPPSDDEYPSVTALLDGRFAVSWWAWGAGSTVETKVQIYSVDGPDNSAGTNGNDITSGGPGADYLAGAAGSDQLSGLGGNDTLIGGAGSDTLTGGDGGDRMVATTSDGNDTMTGGAGFDVLDYSAVGGVVQVNQFAGTVTGSAGNDTLTDIFEQVIGTAFGDVLAGGNGINVLDGNGGADQLFGNGGQDLLRGGDGNDTFYGQTSDGNDTIEGGAGFDLITFASAGGVIQLNMFTNATTGTAGNDSFTGIEYVIGSNFGDIIAGNNGVNAFEGSGGADQLFGNGGVDWMRGGTGNDTVILGTGNDTYYFRNGDGVDTINDFAAGGTDDNIDLTTAATGYASFAAMQGFAGAIVQSGADTLLNLDPGGGSTDRIILKNVTATNLTAADFAF